MSISMKSSTDNGVTLVEETALTEVGSFTAKYDPNYLRDTLAITPKNGCDVEKFIEQVSLVQAKYPHDTKIIVEAFVLPTSKPEPGPAW